MLEVTLISILTLVASAVGTVTGFGTSTSMIPALLFFYPLPQVLLLVGIVHFAVLLLYTLFLFLLASWRIPATRGMAIGGGIASGFMAGMFGVGGAVRGAFLRAFELPKASFIFTAATIALMTDSTRLITYTIDQINLPLFLWYGMAAFLPVSLLGSWIGQRIVHSLSYGFFTNVNQINIETNLC